MTKLQGTIYKSTGSWYELHDAEGHAWQARVKGKLKIDKSIRSTNPIAVGDTVTYEIEDKQANTAIISAIEPRRNYVVRVSPHNRNQKHIVASNLDLALVIATISSPRTSTGFVDRFLVTAEAYHIPALIVINKIDLLREEDLETLATWQEQYSEAGYKVVTLSAFEEDSIRDLRTLIDNRKTLFSGHSGVGKSTIINALIPGLDIRTTEISDKSGKGQHTTTFAEMHDLPEGGQIIDTPGVKEFGLIDVKQEELAHYFPEMRKRINQCKFNNCIHVNEPGCAIKEAVDNHKLSVNRYINYLSILESIEVKW